MAYTVRYGKFKYDKKVYSNRKRHLMIAGTVLCVVILLVLYFPGKVASVRRFLFPYFEKEVRVAFSEMVSSVERGEEVSEAAAAFCREIVFESSDRD